MPQDTLSRRDALRLLASAPLATAFACTRTEVASAQRAVQSNYTPKFFEAHELDTVRLLVDIIIPRDERSGSASDALVPEFMDFMMNDQPERQLVMRGGLAWLDAECHVRFDRSFIDCAEAERTALLDDIAYPERAPKGANDGLSHGIEFFRGFRDLTATGFFTSKMGYEDLQFRGNEFVTEWTGCPKEAFEKIGLDPPASAWSLNPD